MERHPRDRLSRPDTPTKLIPILSDEEIATLLKTCRGKPTASGATPPSSGSSSTLVPDLAMSRYLRARSRHPAADLPDLFLAERGRESSKPNGIKIMLRERTATRGKQSASPEIRAGT